MISNELNNLLSLIAATIFADRHVYDSEVEAFIQATFQLKAVGESEPKLQESSLLDWYESNNNDIRQKLSTPYFKDWYYELLESLSHLEDKVSILDVMRKISSADGEVHISERALITLAERHWGLR